MRTANPALNSSVFSQIRSRGALAPAERMTVQGLVSKTLVLTFLLIVAASFVWSLAFRTASYGGGLSGVPAGLGPWLLGGGLGGLVVALLTTFKPHLAPYTAPIYSVLEGLFIGAISATMEYRFPGIVLQAALLTVGTLMALLLAYKARVIQVTARFRAGVVAATGGIFIVYALSFVLSLFHISFPFLHDASPLGIGISVVVLVVAAMNLVLDFATIEEAAARQAPKYWEWYGAFGLLVTLVWLYVEFLRLLAKLNSRK